VKLSIWRDLNKALGSLWKICRRIRCLVWEIHTCIWIRTSCPENLCPGKFWKA